MIRHKFVQILLSIENTRAILLQSFSEYLLQWLSHFVVGHAVQITNEHLALVCGWLEVQCAVSVKKKTPDIKDLAWKKE